MRAVSFRAACCVALMLVALAGCKNSTSSSSVQSSNKSAQISVSGTPQQTVSAGQSYSFTPSVSDAAGTPTFTIHNAPSWASFNSSTGKLSGTPQAGNAGTYANIVISVNDGRASASLPAFSITVAEAGTGTAEISWTPPTANTNGSTLTNLGGYDIYYGTSATSLTQKVQITNVGVTNYVIGGLTSGTWYFAVSAYTTAGVQSGLSSVVSKTIS